VRFVSPRVHDPSGAGSYTAVGGSTPWLWAYFVRRFLERPSYLTRKSPPPNFPPGYFPSPLQLGMAPLPFFFQIKSGKSESTGDEQIASSRMR